MPEAGGRRSSYSSGCASAVLCFAIRRAKVIRNPVYPTMIRESPQFKWFLERLRRIQTGFRTALQPKLNKSLQTLYAS
jgi:hypothetical protein